MNFEEEEEEATLDGEILFFPNEKFQEFFTDHHPDEIISTSKGYVLPSQVKDSHLAGSFNHETKDIGIRLHENCNLKILDQIITHEVIHKLITEFEGCRASQQFEKISEDFLKEVRSSKGSKGSFKHW